MRQATDSVPIDDNAIASVMERHRRADAARVREVLAKARQLDGLEADDMAALMTSATRSCCTSCSTRPARQAVRSTAGGS